MDGSICGMTMTTTIICSNLYEVGVESVLDIVVPCTYHHSIQPVPGISEEGEFPETEASGNNLYDDFKHVDGCEHASVSGWKEHKCFNVALTGISNRLFLL